MRPYIGIPVWLEVLGRSPADVGAHGVRHMRRGKPADFSGSGIYGNPLPRRCLHFDPVVLAEFSAHIKKAAGKTGRYAQRTKHGKA